MVSPTTRGRRNRHSKPMKASTARGGRGTRQPIPEERLKGRRLGTVSGSRGTASPVMPVKRATWDTLAEDGGLHVLGVGVEDVVVTGEPSEDHDVRFGDGTSGRSEFLTDGEIFEEDTGMSAHEGVG